MDWGSPMFLTGVSNVQAANRACSTCHESMHNAYICVSFPRNEPDVDARMPLLDLLMAVTLNGAVAALACCRGEETAIVNLSENNEITK